MSKISVIVPVYNVENYLENCINSLINQTYKDLEIICVENGSSDNSFEVLQKLAKKDNRIIVKQIENKLVGYARNVGISMSTGDYIGFVDSDDWIDLDYYEKLYNAITKYDADFSCCSIIRKRKHHQKYRLHFTKEEVFEDLEDKLKITKTPKMSYVYNKLYKKSSLLNSGIVFEEGMFFEDVFYNFQIIHKLQKMVTVPDIYYYYRVNQTSIVKTKSDKKTQDKLKATKNLIQYAKENNIELSEKDKILKKEWKKVLGIPLIRIIHWEDYSKKYLFGKIKI